MRFLLPLMLVLILVLPDTSSAHQAASGQDYARYRQSNGSSCCSNQDCRPVSYRFDASGRLLMFPDGRQVEISAGEINSVASDDGQGHWCGIVPVAGGAPITFCAILPQHMTDLRRSPDPPYAGLPAGWLVPAAFRGDH